VIRGDVRAGELLELWEQAESLPPVERALCLAGAAGGPVDQLRHRPVGQTHEYVLGLREAVLGGSLEATASCPRCGARAEFEVQVADLPTQPTGPAELTDGDCLVRLQPPTPADLLDAAATVDPPAAERLLRGRCLTVVAGDGTPLALERVAGEVLERAEARLGEIDPLAEVLVELSCPECGTAFHSDLDVTAFVWAELEARARRILHEVDVLARCYGWTEPEVLDLSEPRRAAYLRLVLDGVA
jgi:hypothetical protein